MPKKCLDKQTQIRELSSTLPDVLKDFKKVFENIEHPIYQGDPLDKVKNNILLYGLPISFGMFFTIPYIGPFLGAIGTIGSMFAASVGVPRFIESARKASIAKAKDLTDNALGAGDDKEGIINQESFFSGLINEGIKRFIKDMSASK